MHRIVTSLVPTLIMSTLSTSHKMQYSIPPGIATKTHLYAPLDSTITEIRVIRLLSSEDFAAPIQCQFLDRPLYINNSSYESLSYVWGAQEFVAEILLHGKPHLVTRNLQMALRYLCLPNSQRTIWVHDICINKNNPNERGQQVRLMRDICTDCEVDLARMLSYDYTLKPPETGSDRPSPARHLTEVQQFQKNRKRK
jgi:hypothetical protein